MTAEELRALQTPLKARYRENPQSAVLQLESTGVLGMDWPTCKITSGMAPVEAGLHPAAGGNGLHACSGEMLLESLVGCAGVTMRAVAMAMGITIRGGTVKAVGTMDFRGTMGISKEVAVGFQSIDLRFDLDSDAPQADLEKLLQLTKRYCVIYQTLCLPPQMSESVVATRR